MPTYAYACTACDHRLEVQQSFTDAALTECPECEGRLRKLFNSVGIVFKGSGFYRTDSRKGSSDGSGEKGDSAKQPAAKESSGSTPATQTNDATSGRNSGAASGTASGKASRKAAGKASGAPASSAA
ncbi:MAG: FmdB family zinc ribbon protein [Kineosporiaceae bacterium]